MSVPTAEICERYLDRLAQILAQANEKDRGHILDLAARIQRELDACLERQRVEADLVKRLNVRPGIDP